MRDRERRWAKKDGEDICKKKSPFPYSRAESLPRQRDVRPLVTNATCTLRALALSFFLPPPASIPLGSPTTFHPYLATTDLYFYRRPVARYVACAHHAPTVSVPPIGRPATGHFGPCGGCASVPRPCLPPHIGDLAVVWVARMVACERAG